MSREFPDNRERLFGREPDLAYLTKRSQKPGVTVILGRPQMGKTWLLLELGRRLSKEPHPRAALSLHQPLSYQVGYFESPGEGADFLLRSVIDLYDSWLSHSTYRQQAQVIYQQQKKDFIGRTGEAFGAVMEKAVGIGPGGAALGALIKKTFEGLAAANRDLNNPAGQLLPRLQIEQARELLELVHKVTQQPLVLIFDQWEKSSALQTEASLLDSFLRQLPNWPPCHIFVGSRPDAAVKESLDEFPFFPGKAEIYDLPRMHLEDSRSRAQVLEFLCKSTPGAAAQKGSDLLELAGGYPGTISQWTSDYFAEKLTSLAAFRQVAKEAEKNQFSEFKVLLKDLPPPLRLLSIRLALLPQTGDPETWSALKEVTLQGVSSDDLDDLRRRNILESVEPPSFGHATRSAAARLWFEHQQNYHYEIRRTCEDLIYRISEQVKNSSASEIPYVSSLRELLGTADELRLGKLPQALCRSAAALFGVPTDRPEMFIGVARELKIRAPSSATLLAMGLLNTLVDAKQEDALPRRDALLEELRQLHAAYPQDAIFIEVFQRLEHACDPQTRTQNAS